MNIMKRLLILFLISLAFLSSACLKEQDSNLKQEVKEKSLLKQEDQKSGVEVRVTEVIDGDTIKVEINGTEYKLRYIGVNTPETKDPRKPVEEYGQEAYQYNKKLVEGKTVRLVKDVSETDKYERLLRYVYVGNLFINAELVKRGYAFASSYPPDVKYSDLFRQLEAQARKSNTGLWAEQKKRPDVPSQKNQINYSYLMSSR